MTGPRSAKGEKPWRPGLREVALLFAFVVALVVLWRMRKGVDFTDESFYAGLPARVVLGDKPFVDELNVGQNAGILLVPFMFVYHAFAGWNGVILFLRVLHVLLYCGVGWSLASVARVRVPLPAAILAGAACIPFLPYGLPGLSYNTLGIAFLTIGLFLTTRALLEPPPADEPPPFWADRLFYAGLCHGAAAFAYPTFLLPVLTTGAIVFLLAPTRIRALLLYAAGGAAFCVLISPVFIIAGIGHIRDALRYLNTDKSSTAAFTWETFQATWQRFLGLHPDLWKYGVGILAVGLAAQRWPFRAGLVAMTIPLWMRDQIVIGNSGVNYFCAMGLYAPLFALLLRDRKTAITIIATAWAPAAVSGIAVSLSSGNGVYAAGVGLYPAAMTGSLLYAIWMHEIAKGWSVPAIRPLAQLAPAAFAYAVVQMSVGEGAIYRDGKISELTVRITHGPYRGLYTTPKRKAWMDSFMADVAPYKSHDRALFIYDFPAGYLFWDVKPLTTSVWIGTSGAGRASFETRYFKAHAKSGDPIFHFNGMRGTYMDLAIQERADKVVSGRDGYEIWVVR